MSTTYNGLDLDDPDEPVASTSLTFSYVEVPVERWAVQVRTSRRRDLERMASGYGLLRVLADQAEAERQKRVLARWLARSLRRKPVRWVLAEREPTISWGERMLEDGVLAWGRVLRATIRVMRPPAGVLEGKQLVEVARGVQMLRVPVLVTHAFEGIVLGVADRPCTRCGLADRHPVHDHRPVRQLEATL